MSTRYEDMFAVLKERNEGAFVPFVMLNDPSADENFEIISAIIEAGADGLELGIPFSDPVADGTTIQRSHLRALEAASTVKGCLAIIRRVRDTYPTIPIGMLVYVNVAFVHGLDAFYEEMAEAGADAVLLPDVPVREGKPFVEAAERHGIDPVFIAPAQASADTLEGVAELSRGYIYAISRDGVTGTERQSDTKGLDEVVNNVTRFGGAPVLLGFGISEPRHVAEAIEAGAAGAITGSAITKIIEEHVGHDGHIGDMEPLKSDLSEYVSLMKDATRQASL